MNNGNYIGRRDDAGGSAADAAGGAAAKEDDHAHEAALGFPLHTDGPDRLGWLMNMNQVRFVLSFMATLFDSWACCCLGWLWRRARSCLLTARLGSNEVCGNLLMLEMVLGHANPCIR
jgi:hypothetical protein